MVRAILEGRKTQTRRIVKPQPVGEWAAPGRQSGPYGAIGERLWVKETWGYRGCTAKYPAATYHATAHYHADDTRRDIPFATFEEMMAATPEQNIKYPSGFDELNEDEQEWKRQELISAWWERKKKIVSIHMPRWASRITLEITDVRVQRLQDISAADARAEGHPAEPECSDDPAVHDDAARDWFMDLWNSINAKRAPWASNPWVWAISFRLSGKNG